MVLSWVHVLCLSEVVQLCAVIPLLFLYYFCANVSGFCISALFKEELDRCRYMCVFQLVHIGMS